MIGSGRPCPRGPAACPPAQAAKFPRDLAELVGYTMPAAGLGWVTEYHHPFHLLGSSGIPAAAPGQKPADWGTGAKNAKL